MCEGWQCRGGQGRAGHGWRGRASAAGGSDTGSGALGICHKLTQCSLQCLQRLQSPQEGAGLRERSGELLQGVRGRRSCRRDQKTGANNNAMDPCSTAPTEGSRRDARSSEIHTQCLACNWKMLQGAPHTP